MAYYLRFIITDTQPIILATVRNAIKGFDSRYNLTLDPFDTQTGELYYDDEPLGTVELNTSDDDIFREDIDELCDLIAHSVQDTKQAVLEQLERSEAMVAVSARWPGDDPAPTLDKLEALWDWLFANYSGLLQADNDGFYDQDGLILAMNLKI